MPSDYAYVALFAFVGVAFVVVTLALSRLVRPCAPTAEKLSPYECAEEPIGQAQVQFRVGYYVFALIFVIFDVETVFIYPWAVRLRHLAQTGLGLMAFLEMVIFLAILLLGLAYAWRKGALRWE
jgi:NADH-quinone oxidoreductase subunit A